MTIPSFIGKVRADSSGKVWPCKKCQKEGKVGDPLYMQNLGTKEQPNWISCIDLQCFIAQGGTEPKKEASTGGKNRPVRTHEEKIKDVEAMIDGVWEVCLKKSKTAIQSLFGQSDPKEVLILAEVFYKGAVVEYAS